MASNLTRLNIAEIAHNVNKEYCISVGDYSQVSWNKAPEWQKISAVNGVEFHLKNPGASASASHQNWLKEKMQDGWVYGPVKNPELKQHPCCVAFEQLPTEQKAKDHIFKSIVNQLKDYLE